jgi:putative nucleotidyltransferase with HDIG domain
MTKYNIEELPNNIQNIFKYISLWADIEKYEIYAVGGFVRDLIKYNKISDDIDFIVDKKCEDNPAITFVNILEAKGVGINKALYENFGTAKLEIDGMKVEFVMPRNEKYTEDSRKPIVEKINIQEDAIRRDFTINTLMMNIVTGDILDPTGKGIDDLNKGIIRSANPDIKKMIIDDPLRLLRCIRFAMTKDFIIDDELIIEIFENRERLSIISKERIRVELDKMLMADVSGSRVWHYSYVKNIMRTIIPELNELMLCKETLPWHWDESTYEHTIRVIYNCPKNINVRRAALFHDIGKPVVRTMEGEKAHFYGHEISSVNLAEKIMKNLTYSNDDIKIVKLLIKNHMKPHMYKPEGEKSSWGDKAIRKYIIELGEWLDMSIALAYADSKGSSPADRENHNNDKMKKFEEHIARVKSSPIVNKPIINGDELMKIFNKPSGIWIKEIINWQMEFLYEFPNVTIEEMEANLKVRYRKEIIK